METHQKITYISGNRNPNQAFYISGNGNFQSTPEISYILGNGNLPKNLYVSGNGNPENIFIFSEAELFYISGISLVYSKPDTYSEHCQTSTMESFAKTLLPSAFFSLSTQTFSLKNFLESPL